MSIHKARGKASHSGGAHERAGRPVIHLSVRGHLAEDVVEAELVVVEELFLHIFAHSSVMNYNFMFSYASQHIELVVFQLVLEDGSSAHTHTHGAVCSASVSLRLAILHCPAAAHCPRHLHLCPVSVDSCGEVISVLAPRGSLVHIPGGLQVGGGTGGKER